MARTRRVPSARRHRMAASACASTMWKSCSALWTSASRSRFTAGARPGTLYPGVHWVLPLIEDVQLYSIRDNVFATSLIDDPKKEKPDALRVQTREGLSVGLAVAVRYRLDPSRLAYIHSNPPQPV